MSKKNKHSMYDILFDEYIELLKNMPRKTAVRVLSKSKDVSFDGLDKWARRNFNSDKSIKDTSLFSKKTLTEPTETINSDNLNDSKHKSNTINDTLSELGIDPNYFKGGWVKTPKGSFRIDGANNDTESFEKLKKELSESIKRDSKKFKIVRETKVYSEESDDTHALIIDIADLHIGKYCSIAECQNEYNVSIAITRAIHGVNALIEKANRLTDIDKIFFIIGNDVLHTDGAKTTTKGTVQDMDGLWHEHVLIASRLYTQIIETLLQTADVHVIHCRSNHDDRCGSMLAEIVKARFHQNDEVTFDTSQHYRKYAVYGKSLLGFEHGDGAKFNEYASIIPAECREMYSQTTNTNIYLHHRHHFKLGYINLGEDIKGVTVQFLRSPCSSDAWSTKKGYVGSTKSIDAFLIHKERGEEVKLHHNFI